MTEIAFLTLFLGLAAGPQNVAVDVRGPAARVEIWLDAARVAEIHHAPWQANVALGTEVRPHRLEARALDAQGAVVARAMQVLNLPRPAAETQILLERDATNRVIGARLAWQNLTNDPPTSISLELDDKPRAIDGSGYTTLPMLAPDTIHVLTTQVRFPNGALARSDVAFGGELGESVGGELTGVPLAGKAMRAADVAGLAGMLFAGGTPRTPAAVENGAGSLVVVRAATAAAKLCRGQDEASLGISHSSASVGPATSGSAAARNPAFALRLEASDSLRFIFPWVASASTGGVPFALFPSSPELANPNLGLERLLCIPNSSVKELAPRLADAVAIAGLHATVGSPRRAVLPILGKEETDQSQFAPAAVRAYLHALHVPLVVWASEKRPAGDPWGAAEMVDNAGRLRQAMARLLALLAEQRVVWVDGAFLPNELTLSPAAVAKGLRFADEPVAN